MKVTESRESQNALNPGRIFPFSVTKKRLLRGILHILGPYSER